MKREFVADFETINDDILVEKQRVWLWAIRKATKERNEPCEIGYFIETFFNGVQHCLAVQSFIFIT